MSLTRSSHGRQTLSAGIDRKGLTYFFFREIQSARLWKDSIVCWVTHKLSELTSGRGICICLSRSHRYTSWSEIFSSRTITCFKSLFACLWKDVRVLCMRLAWASKIRFLFTLKPIWLPRVPITLFNNVTVLILSVCKPRSFTCSSLLSGGWVKDVHSSPERALISCASHLRTTLRGCSYIRMLSTWVWNRMTLESQRLVDMGAATWGICTNWPLLSSWLLAPLLKIWVVRTSTPHLVVIGTDIVTHVWPFFCRSCFLDWKDLVAWLLLKMIETGMLLC